MQSLPGTKKPPHKFNVEFKIGIQQNGIPGTYFKCTLTSFSVINFALCFISHCTVPCDYITY